MNKLCFSLLLLLFCFGCAGELLRPLGLQYCPKTSINKHGKDIKLAKDLKEVKGCKFISSTISKRCDGVFDRPENHINSMMNGTRFLGGDTLLIDKYEDKKFYFQGKIYKCGK